MTQKNHDTEIVNPIVLFSINHPKIITWIMTLFTILIISMAALPNIYPEQLSFLPTIKVDTDPENMLSDDEPVRVYNHQMKTEFSLNDIVVVGITNKQNTNGVFNSKSLANIYALTQFSRGIKWEDKKNPGKMAGVIAVDILAPSTVDNIEQGGLGTVNFNWLMPEPPKSDEEAIAIRDRAMNIPFLNGTLVSDDGKAIALYLPITNKNVSYQVREQLLAKIAEFGATEEEYYITGLPVAQDTFGVEMFKQMAISAPLAMLVIFLLLWWFFKRLIFVTSPMIVAMVCALSTMGLLIITGNTIHIMSSMIPIFIMPIAILDAVHILSDFFDRYNTIRDKRKTIIHVMNELFTPMLITSLTTIAGFASLALTPIPPVQVFGIYIAIGVFLAWIWSVTFIPAFIVSISDEKLASFISSKDVTTEENKTLMAKLLAKTGQFTYNHALLILMFTLTAVGVAGYGISKINVNDNPIKWFAPSHIIRVADRVLNEHFGGTYMAYLALEVNPNAVLNADFKTPLLTRLAQAQQDAINDEYAHAEQIFGTVQTAIKEHTGDKASLDRALNQMINQGLDNASDDEFDTWDQVQLFIDRERQLNEIFKQPEALTYLATGQPHINFNLKTSLFL